MENKCDSRFDLYNRKMSSGVAIISIYPLIDEIPILIIENKIFSFFSQDLKSIKDFSNIHPIQFWHQNVSYGALNEHYAL